jgi:hypothetical protein
MEIQNSRYCNVSIMLDTNSINAKGEMEAVGKLEQWHKDGVICLCLSEVARRERLGMYNQCSDLVENALTGEDEIPEYQESDTSTNVGKVRRKVESYVFTNSARISEEQHELYSKIETIIFPNGTTADGQRRDVDIVYQAADWQHILVTTDGDSKRQPRGILGSQAELAALNVQVMCPQKAVEFTQSQIENRDRLVTLKCKSLGNPIPEWVGKD